MVDERKGAQFRRARPNRESSGRAVSDDRANRPIQWGSDGTINSLLAKPFDIGRQTVLLPTISPNGARWTDAQALSHYRSTGEHLGIFNSRQAAKAYAKRQHLDGANHVGAGLSAPTSPKKAAAAPPPAPEAASPVPLRRLRPPEDAMPGDASGSAAPVGHGFAGSPELAARRHPAAAPPRFFAGPGAGELAPPGMAVPTGAIGSWSGVGAGATADLVPWSVRPPAGIEVAPPSAPRADGDRRSVRSVALGPDPVLDETGDNAVLRLMRGAQPAQDATGAPGAIGGVPGVTGRGLTPPRGPFFPIGDPAFPDFGRLPYSVLSSAAPGGAVPPDMSGTLSGGNRGTPATGGLTRLPQPRGSQPRTAGPAPTFPSVWGVQPERAPRAPSMDAISLLEQRAGRSMPSLKGSRYDGGFDGEQPLPATAWAAPDFAWAFREPGMVAHGPIQPVPGSKYNPPPDIVLRQMDQANQAERDAEDKRLAFENAVKARAASLSPRGRPSGQEIGGSIGGSSAVFGPDAPKPGITIPPAVPAPTPAQRYEVFDPFHVLDHHKDQSRYPGFPPVARGAPEPAPPRPSVAPALSRPSGIAAVPPGPTTMASTWRYDPLTSANTGRPVRAVAPLGATPSSSGAPSRAFAGPPLAARGGSAAAPADAPAAPVPLPRLRPSPPLSDVTLPVPRPSVSLVPLPMPRPPVSVVPLSPPRPPVSISPLPHPRPVSIAPPAKPLFNGRILGQTIGSILGGPVGGLLGALFGGGLGSGTFGSGQAIAYPGAVPNSNRYGLSPMTPPGFTAANFTPGSGGSIYAYNNDTGGHTVDQYGRRVPTGSYISSTGNTITYTMD